MALNRQIHLYSLDTSSFYTDNEKLIGDKLSKCYPIRKRIKERKGSLVHKNASRLHIFEHQLRRINRIINHYKEELIAEFEVTKKNGLIRQLRDECLMERNIVSIFESSLTRTLEIENNTLTKDLMIVQVYFFQVAEDIIKNGFTYQGEEYVLFSASAGQIRTKKFVVIKKSILEKHENQLTCGLDWKTINEKGGINANKYLAYYALANSATDIWEEFDIDKAIVVDDFETIVQAQVDYIDDVTYEVERCNMGVPIPHTDGCGIKLMGRNKMIRLPWFKGLMGVIDYRTMILEWRELYNDDTIGIVKDIYGKEYDIIADDIEFIFTKSQFKTYKYFDSWKHYTENFKKYGCEACMCNEEEEKIKDAKINYQMLQSLWDMTENEMRRIAQRTIHDINNLGNDYRTMMKILGINEYNSNKSYIQKCVEIYPELMRDKYNRQILKDCKASLVKEGKAGRLSISGKYTFVLPDLYAFCEWLFLGEENPNGLLEDGEVYCNLYRHGWEVDCLRSPHLYKEHAIRTNAKSEEADRWFNTNAIYVSVKDVISKILQFD